jgi:hypothetical protein
MRNPARERGIEFAPSLVTVGFGLLTSVHVHRDVAFSEAGNG